jgi:hypothetical protein
VSGRQLPIPAKAFGQKTLNSVSSVIREPVIRRTTAPRRKPALRRPRRSSRSRALKTASTSSSRSVGAGFLETDRNSAASEMFAVGSGSCTSSSSTSSKRVLPERFSALVIAR